MRQKHKAKHNMTSTIIENDSINIPELANSPDAPVAGRKKIYVKSDGKVYTVNAQGVEAALDAQTPTASLYVVNNSASLFSVYQPLDNGKYARWDFKKEATSSAWMHWTVYICDNFANDNLSSLISNDIGWALYMKPTGHSYQYVGNWHLSHTATSVYFTDEAGNVVDPTASGAFWCKALRIYQTETLQHPDTGVTKQADFKSYLEINTSRCIERLRITFSASNAVYGWNAGQIVGLLTGNTAQTKSWVMDGDDVPTAVGGTAVNYTTSKYGYFFGSHDYVVETYAPDSVDIQIYGVTGKVYPRASNTETNYTAGDFIAASWEFRVFVDPYFSERI